MQQYYTIICVECMELTHAFISLNMTLTHATKKETDCIQISSCMWIARHICFKMAVFTVNWVVDTPLGPTAIGDKLLPSLKVLDRAMNAIEV